MPEVLQGLVSRVIFRNPENGYSVLSVLPNKEYIQQDSQQNHDDDSFPDLPVDNSIKVIGNMPGNGVREGDEYRFTGKWVNHSQYGRQFKFDDFEVILPDNRGGIIAYLCSDHFYGIGPVAAGKVVDALGEDALEKLKANPDIAYSIPGISPKQAQEIANKMREHSSLGELITLICGDEVSTNLAARICAKYGGDAAIKVVKNNPYQLIEDLDGVGFKIADRIARATGVALDSPYRIEAAIRHVLQEAQHEGHVALSAGEINEKVMELLGPGCGVEPKDIGKIGRGMIAAEELRREKLQNQDLVYLSWMHRAEVSLAAKVRYMSELEAEPLDAEMVGNMVDDTAVQQGIEYAPEQRQAIITALASSLSIITGGPGTGKSTITLAIVDLYKRLYPDHRHEIYLASPTGRAAKRLAEATGREAKTIHRLLRYNPFEGGFEFNEHNPLPGPGLLIVDEFSMCDVELADDLFRALPEDIKVVLVGDIDQLPSVGPGSVLRDTIVSGVVPVTRLQYVYRQGKESTIAWLADKIRKGEKVDLAKLAAKVDDFEFIPAEDPSDAAYAIEQLVERLTSEGLTPMDFQVLTPLKVKGPAAADYLNKMIQRRVNPPDESKQELVRQNMTYRLGDKVMVIKNDYKKLVFNGDLGVVSGIEKGGIWADIDGAPVFFGAEDMDKITLAYAYTVHKSQGGEFPLAIVVCLRSHYIMLQRNLIYTAITRAKKRLIIVGQQSAFDVAVRNNKIIRRNTLLAERLKGVV